MNLFRKHYKIRKTIWPYDEGYGVLITQFGKPDTVFCHGWTKDQCKNLIEELKQEDKM